MLTKTIVLIFQKYNGFNFFTAMATAEVIKRLSTRATAAEKMIQLLKTQINEIKASQGMACGVDEELKKLRI